MLILRKCGHRELEHYYSLFEVDFDKKELLPFYHSIPSILPLASLA